MFGVTTGGRLKDDGEADCGILGCESTPEDGSNYCEDCLAISPGLDDERDGGDERNDDVPEAFACAIEYFHNQLDTKRAATDGRITTPRKYFTDERGWSNETIDRAQLGWAPADEASLRKHLRRNGFTDDAIRGTGLFTENLRILWRGRYVFPYFDAGGQPVYAISRNADHPDDWFGGQKYAKAVKTKDYSEVDEPIYGLETIRDGEPVLITEGIADAITAHQHGYPCVSPVTTRFKHDDRGRLLDALDGRGVPRVYVIQDAERATSDVDEEGRLTVEQFGEGMKGAVDTAAHLADHGFDARVGKLPRPGLEKIDLDDYLQTWVGEDGLTPILASANPAAQHPTYDDGVTAGQTRSDALAEVNATKASYAESDHSAGRGRDTSALFGLDIFDVSGLPEDYRGKNPLGHHGDSENYFTITDEEIGEYYGYDHKHKAVYLPLSYLLCEADVRRPASPNGPLSDQEVFVAWRYAKRKGLIPDDDPIPRRALIHVAADAGLCNREDVEDGWNLPVDAYNDALTVLEDDLGVNPGRGPIGVEAGTGSGARAGVEVCEPPARGSVELDVAEHRDELTGERFDAVLKNDQLHVWADEAGVGKTTSSALGALKRGEDHVVYFDKHRKAREHVVDNVLPEWAEYYHLKGGEQKRDGGCMDVDHARERGEDVECPEHGHPSDCPSMCPVYDQDPDNDVRKAYDALVSEVGPFRAHMILGFTENDEHLWHPEECAWMEQYDEVDSHANVAAVHPYLTQKTVREDRLNIVDEAVDLHTEDRTLSVEDLTRMANALEDIADVPGTPDGLRELARFARDLTDAIVDGAVDLRRVDPPALDWHTYRDVRDPVSGEYVERDLPGETFARLKVEYSESILARMRRDEWDGEPLSIDPLLTAAVKAGLPTDAVMQAVALPPILETCPWCRSDVGYRDGARHCSSDDCGWNEREHTLTRKDGEQARATTWIHTDHNDRPVGLGYRSLPLPSQLPDPASTLVLDATATPEKIAALFDVPVDDIVISSDQGFEIPNLRTTQVLDGQYHGGTLKEALDEERTLAKRAQRAIDTAGQVHRCPLFVVNKDLIPRFDFPENGEVMYYHATRGLNREECDAVMLIGAPHANIEDLQRNADLLAMGHNALRVAGEEHSTRRNAPNPPVYRKLNFEDENGKGRAVPTKHYTGLIGGLFRETRENELEQAIHRIRPLLADDGETKHAYLLTNVPTDLPIDEVCSFEELADPLEAMLPVPEGAIELLEAVRDAARGDVEIDGFRAETAADQLVDRDPNGTVRINKREATELAARTGVQTGDGTTPTYRTVARWVDVLEDVGLFDADGYEQRRGVRFNADTATLTQALSVLSGNGGFKVAAVRRFRALVERADESLRWLTWARETLRLHGDRCEWDPPPNPAG